MPINPEISENKLHIICRVLTVYEMLAHLIFTTALEEATVHAPISDEGLDNQANQQQGRSQLSNPSFSGRGSTQPLGCLTFRFEEPVRKIPIQSLNFELVII